jgi:hypothetical protein
MFDRYNIVSEDDLRTAMQKTSLYVDTLPTPGRRAYAHDELDSESSRRVEGGGRRHPLSNRSIRMVAGAGFEPATFGL